MIYVHIPFCRSFCTYCGFYSEVAPKCRRQEDSRKQEALFEAYASALEAEIRIRHSDIERVFASSDVNTLYIGGGTPSVLPPEVFERLLKCLSRSGFREFTVEVNPEDIVEKGTGYVRRLLELGVSRISMGVQSFDDGILKWMNRRHTSSQAVRAYHILEEAGVENISIDLIFGLPHLTEELWRETIGKALNISSRGAPPKHISAYQLSVEEDSILDRMRAKGLWTEAADEVCERQYSILQESLAVAGYHHYEISNFALPGYEAVHNSAYWRHVPYVGLGPGAHSYLEGSSGPYVPAALSQQCSARSEWDREMAGDVPVRLWNEADLQKYIKAGETGDFSPVQGGELLDDEQLIMERIMLGLRTSAGVPEDYLRLHCKPSALDEALRCGSLIMKDDGYVRIPEDRFFVSDNIILNLLCV